MPHLAQAAESDKKEGDGACDFKRGQYMTLDYCYFEGYHKTSLLGASDSNIQFHVTWHHNWWKNCESRGPLGRQANVHIYNCFYDGQSSYAQNTRANCYIFSEYNTFLNCKGPREVDSGAIKSYNDSLSSCINDSGATTVTDKNQKVSSGNRYENFDTNASISYIPSGDYKLDTDHAVAQANVKAYCGPMKAQPIKPEEVNGSTVVTERIPKNDLVLPYNKAINNTVATAASGTFDNIVFNNVKPSSSNVKYGKDSVGQYVVFKVGERVDVTLDGTASVLVDASGNTVADIPGSATNLPAGIYYVQPATIQPAKTDTPMTYKEGTLSRLDVVPTKVTTPPHEHDFTNWERTVAPTCTRTGMEQATCSCGETRSREIAEKMEHDYVGGACKWCGVLDGTFNGNPDAPEIAVTDLVLSETGVVNVLQDDQVTVVATVEPKNATDRAVTWTSSNEAVAKVSARGVITGKGPGTATITATTANGISKTVTVKVIGVQTDTYTFSAPAAHPEAQTTADPAVPDGSKYGTGSYFTNTGAKNTWKAQDFSKGKRNTVALLLAGAQGSSLDFTVSPDCENATVTVTFRSTGGSNRSAIGLLDESGNLVNNNEGTRLRVCLGKSNTAVNYKLAPGTYKIVVPANIQPDEVNPDWEAFPNPTNTSDPDDPNKRGTQLVQVSVVEHKTISDEDIVPVDSVELDQTSIRLEEGTSSTLHATVKPDNATFKKVDWTSDNKSVANVNMGVVTAWGVGTATITATAGGKSATCTVTVTAAGDNTVKVERITINGGDSVDVDATLALTAVVEPDEADNKGVTWTSGDTKIATVNASGVVTGVAPGTVTITATAKDGSKVKATKTVTVKAAIVAEGNWGATDEKVTWALDSEGELSITNTENHMASDDTVFVSLWDANDKFLGVKVIKTSQLAATVGETWDHIKLIWVDSDDAPKCDFATVEHTTK